MQKITLSALKTLIHLLQSKAFQPNLLVHQNWRYSKGLALCNSIFCLRQEWLPKLFVTINCSNLLLINNCLGRKNEWLLLFCSYERGHWCATDELCWHGLPMTLLGQRWLFPMDIPDRHSRWSRPWQVPVTSPAGLRSVWRAGPARPM